MVAPTFRPPTRPFRLLDLTTVPLTARLAALWLFALAGDARVHLGRPVAPDIVRILWQAN